MPYLSRLLAESGVNFTPPSPPAQRAGADELAIEAEDVVEMGQPTASSRVSAPDTVHAETPPSAASGEAQPGTAQTIMPTQPLARAAAAALLPTQDFAAEHHHETLASPQPPVQPPPANAAPERGETFVIEKTREERVLETLAAVRAWTLEPAPEQRVVPLKRVTEIEMPSVSEQPFVPLKQVTEIETPSGSGQPFVTIQQAPPVTQLDQRAEAGDAAEPEVINLSLSIGAIELTVDAANGLPAPSRQREAPPAQHVSEADVSARLRRHYYRTPIGW